MASKKLILGLALVAGAAYMLTRKKKRGTSSGTGSGGNTFQLSSLTNDLWSNGVGVSPYNSQRGWGSTTQLLVDKAGNESLLGKIGNGTKLKLQDGTVITAENILDLNIDDFYRISTYEDVSGLVNAAGYPAYITIV
jgi:hypothetical protein